MMSIGEFPRNLSFGCDATKVMESRKCHGFRYVILQEQDPVHRKGRNTVLGETCACFCVQYSVK